MIRGFPSQDARQISQARLCLGNVAPEFEKTVPFASFEFQRMIAPCCDRRSRASQAGGSNPALQINRLIEQSVLRRAVLITLAGSTLLPARRAPAPFLPCRDRCVAAGGQRIRSVMRYVPSTEFTYSVRWKLERPHT
jgi:hypothetical protein